MPQNTSPESGGKGNKMQDQERVIIGGKMRTSLKGRKGIQNQNEPSLKSRSTNSDNRQNFYPAVMWERHRNQDQRSTGHTRRRSKSHRGPRATALMARPSQHLERKNYHDRETIDSDNRIGCLHFCLAERFTTVPLGLQRSASSISTS